MFCRGEGSPTIILTEGGGGWSGGWSQVMPALAIQTRVCAWDRPGYGISEGVDRPITLADTAADLAAALDLAGNDDPLILVGQSLGGLEMLLFADTHPERIAGMILVDPSFPGQAERGLQLAAEYGLPTDLPPGFEVLWRNCAQKVRAGELSRDDADDAACFAMLAPPLPPQVTEPIVEQMLADPAKFETMAHLWEFGLQEGSAIAINADRDYGDIPLLVLTATVSPLPPRIEVPPEMRAFAEASMDLSNTAHDELAALSTRGFNARVPGAPHLMHQSHPQVVIDAIEAVLREVRAD